MSNHDPQSVARHARRRWLKRLLRYAPRRARFHHYPVVGRFAAGARRRAYLWSFKPAHVRPAIYLGSILSLTPTIGIQLAIGFVLCIALRANFMVTGVLTFITNPITIAPLYFVTFHVGRFVMTHLGLAADATSAAKSEATSTTEPVLIDMVPTETLPAHLDWMSGFGSTVIALMIGATICGVILGALLDLIYSSSFKLSHPTTPLRETRRNVE